MCVCVCVCGLLACPDKDPSVDIVELYTTVIYICSLFSDLLISYLFKKGWFLHFQATGEARSH